MADWLNPARRANHRWRRSYIRYRTVNRAWYRHEAGSLFLHSMPKSGTNFLRLLTANYLALRFQGGTDRVTYSELSRRYPVAREHAMLKPDGWPSRTPPDEIRRAGYTDFIYGHATTLVHRSPAAAIWHLYRNPLDNAVSRYFYMLRYRGDDRELDADLALELLAKYPSRFHAGMVLEGQGGLRVSYEELWKHPAETFERALHHAKLPVDSDLIVSSVDRASIRRVREEEAKSGPIHAPEGFVGKFARSGEVGQWKEYFSQTDVARIADHLRAHGVELETFELE
jgi:hypothetical protein